MQSEIQMKRIEVNNNKCNNNNKYLYYIDTSVLLENIPLIKFLKTTSTT